MKTRYVFRVKSAVRAGRKSEGEVIVSAPYSEKVGIAAMIEVETARARAPTK